MTKSAQRRAVENHRERMRQAGVERFEVRAPVSDKPLIREIARRLSAGDSDLRQELERDLTPEKELEPTRGAIWRAFRNSPLVGADINLEREWTTGRDVDL